jgi:hypothetical protein
MKWCLIGLGVLLGGLAIASQWNLSRVKGYAHTIKTSPQSIKVADLSANGPGDNPYVTLTDYRFRPGDVEVTVWKGNQSKMAGTAYFPLEPARKAAKGKKPAKEPEKKTPRVVVVVSADTPAQVKAFVNRTTITGIVKGSTFETWDVPKVPVEWGPEGGPKEKVWLVWADERPEKPNLARTEKVSLGLGLAGMVCLALGVLAFAVGGERRQA